MNNQEPNQEKIPATDLCFQAANTLGELPFNSHAGVGLAVASFILGLVSLPLSLFLIGLIFGIVGFVFGIVHLGKKLPLFKAMAIWGVILSLLGIMAALGFGMFYGIKIHQVIISMREMQSSQELGQSAEEYIGTPAPDINLIDMNGNEIILSKLRGKRIVLDFWATWCPPCKKEIPHFIKLAGQVTSENLVIIGISSEKKSVLENFIKKSGINYPIASANDLPAPFTGILSIPTTFFIDRNGIIQNVLVGYHDYDTLKANALAENYQGEPKTAARSATVGT